MLYDPCVTGSSPFLDPEVVQYVEAFQRLVLREALQDGTSRGSKVVEFTQPQDLEVTCSCPGAPQLFDAIFFLSLNLAIFFLLENGEKKMFDRIFTA